MISAWILLLLSVPILLLGEVLVRRIGFLSRYNIPSPVVGGLLVSVAVLLVNFTGGSLKFATKVDAPWWTWLITTQAEWQKVPSLNVHQPFLVAFFTCIGLNASWALAKRGGIQVALFWVVAGVLAIFQNVIGLVLAKILGIPPLLGLACGSLTMTGGHATALGFADEFVKAGLGEAAVIGAAAATFGLIAGGLIGGPVGGRLIRRFDLKSAAGKKIHLEAGQSGESGILSDFKALWKYGCSFIVHLVVLLACIKFGSYISHIIQQQKVPFPSLTSGEAGMTFGFRETKLTFPVYMGALLLGVFVRNVTDLTGKRWIRTEIVDTLASVTLSVFLAIAMMSLSLKELAGTALPMLVVLAVQVLAAAVFAFYLTYRFMGRDFDAAVMAGGHCGFALGATPNAVANMKSLVETYGPAPRAFLVVPIVGAFLLDFLNAINITFFLNIVK